MTTEAQDPYLFGGSPKQVRRTQERFAGMFLPGKPVLDIGCGRGIFLQLLRERGIDTVGIDLHEPAVELCRKAGFNVILADALAYLPAHGSEFGGIFCSHVIEHLDFERAGELVRLAGRALSPGGILVVVTPNAGDIGVMTEGFWLDPTHVRPYPLLLLEAMVREAGLEVIGRGAFHGGLPKREWPRVLRYRALLGSFYGRPNAFIAARRPA